MNAEELKQVVDRRRAQCIEEITKTSCRCLQMAREYKHKPFRMHVQYDSTYAVPAFVAKCVRGKILGDVLIDPNQYLPVIDSDVWDKLDMLLEKTAVDEDCG